MPCINYKKDEQYLVNKFRNPVFDPSTGMSNNELRDKMKEVAENFINQGLSRPEVKAACFKYICENMQIDVDPHDFFPMFGTWIKPLRPIGPLIIIWYDEMWEKQCKDIAEEYIEAGWEAVYYRINFGKAENTTEFVFCTKLGSHNFVRDVINKQELKYDVVKKKRIP
jgi:hypothetical protein